MKKYCLGISMQSSTVFQGLLLNTFLGFTNVQKFCSKPSNHFIVFQCFQSKGWSWSQMIHSFFTVTERKDFSDVLNYEIV